MTDIGDRVKEIRKASSNYKTLEKFGAKIGLSKTAISDIENGRRNLTEQSFKSICREFDVNPDWLRDGSGPMFKEKSRNDEIAAFIDDILKNEPDGVKAHLIAALARLDDRDWDRIAEVAQSLVAEQNAEKELSAAETQQAAADRQRVLEEGTQKSSVFRAG